METNGDFNASYASEMRKSRLNASGNADDSIDREAAAWDFYGYYYNLASCVLELAQSQDKNIEMNQTKLEHAIEEGKMAFERAQDLQLGVEELLEEAECTLTQRSELCALLAVTAATSLIT